MFAAFFHAYAIDTFRLFTLRFAFVCRRHYATFAADATRRYDAAHAFILPPFSPFRCHAIFTLPAADRFSFSPPFDVFHAIDAGAMPYFATLILLLSLIFSMPLLSIAAMFHVSLFSPRCFRCHYFITFDVYACAMRARKDAQTTQRTRPAAAKAPRYSRRKRANSRCGAM